MKRDLDIEQGLPSRQTSTLTKRLAHRPETEAPAPAKPSKRAAGAPRPDGAPRPAGDRARRPDGDGAPRPAGDGPPVPAPDIPEHEGVVPAPKPKRPSKS